MRIHETVEHDASPQQVFEMICSPDYQELKCTRSGALEHEVAIEVEEDARTIVTRRRLPTDAFPDFVQKFVGDSVDVIETQVWGLTADEDGGHSASLKVEIPRTPVTMSGSVYLTPAGEGTEHTVEGELKASVPFLGAKIEKAIAPVIASSLRLEGRLSREWIEDASA
ncbi:DUF2505 domain-containing protein [Ornithinimicrobium cryptoxanthini]|uniref:DUF2505 domain-containing protein n=1 Tax=Ornithinimicrobium cryptoxanthini TaxID=2934161 RepID=A0ABY4YFD2_9MICO|nr:DUF2505 domain-containing protein [Ornithinimicrobium cryptoxanthini]USQ75270.1 DUF2505 domain-containing protein [Ornithinimicrobium cryptoxanthini]